MGEALASGFAGGASRSRWYGMRGQTQRPGVGSARRRAFRPQTEPLVNTGVV